MVVPKTMKGLAGVAFAAALVLTLSALLRAQTSAPSTAPAQTSPAPADSSDRAWAFNLSMYGVFVPDYANYGNPVATADHGHLHLEGRYNYENLHTGSAWLGYNFSWGKKTTFDLTPMVGAVFGRTDGVAPGLEATFTWKKLELYVENEYVFDLHSKDGNFYYAFPQVTYAVFDWLSLGLAAQRTKAYRTTLDTQRGFVVSATYKKWTASTYVFNLGFAEPTVMTELGVSF